MSSTGITHHDSEGYFKVFTVRGVDDVCFWRYTICMAISMSVPVLLVIEDELPLLEAIVVKARQNGFEVVSGRSVAEGIEMLKSISSVDAVWVDHFLPDQIGLELVKFMRKDKRWKTTPIFLVTNAVEPEIVNQYLKADVQGYYTKVLMSLQDIVFDIKARLTSTTEQSKVA